MKLQHTSQGAVVRQAVLSFGLFCPLYRHAVLGLGDLFLAGKRLLICVCCMNLLAIATCCPKGFVMRLHHWLFKCLVGLLASGVQAKPLQQYPAWVGSFKDVTQVSVYVNHACM